MKPIHTLFRRTLFALGAIAALTVTGEASAQAGSITLSNGGSCNYTTMVVDPSGAVNVTCDTGTPPPAGSGTFSVSALLSSLNVSTGSASAFRVSRTGGTANEVSVSFDVTGECAAVTASPLIFPAGSATSQTINVSTGASAGTCSVTLTVGAPGTPGTTVRSIPVSAPSSNGCPTSPIVPQSLGDAGLLTSLVLPSDGMQSYKLPLPTSGKITGIFKLSPNANSYPRDPWYIEAQISKCPGTFQDVVGPGCFVRSSNATAIFSVYYQTGTTATLTQAKLEPKGYCFAPTTDGPWYVNVRYVYASCASGPNCGWHSQWTNSGY